MGLVKLFYKSRIHGQSLPCQANHRPTSALVQVQDLLGQNDEADTNTNDFKHVLTKFKQELKTLPTIWRVKFFLQLREGVTKNPQTALKGKTELGERQFDILACWQKAELDDTDSRYPLQALKEQQACRPLPPRSSGSLLETPALPISFLHSLSWRIHLVQMNLRLKLVQN